MASDRTTGDYRQDQRVYLDRQPLIRACAALLRDAQRRDLDADGVRLMRRIVRALWVALVAVRPRDSAPVAWAVLFGHLRAAVHASALGLLTEDETQRTGNDGPLLNPLAIAALAALDVADATTDRAALLQMLLDGTSWRQP